MRPRWIHLASASLFVALTGCSEDGGITPNGDGGRPRGDSGTITPPPADTGIGPMICLDEDNDGIADNLENGDTDGDGTPDRIDEDSDNDGFTDADEAVGNYPGAMMLPRLMCGRQPDDCDADGRPNFRDLDSDNDGLSDAEERMAGTNACSEDSDGDGVPDLTERVAGSNPADRNSMPPSGSLYVTLPYHPPGEMGPHVQRRFTFQTRIRAADIFFVVDTTGSMGGTIETVKSTFMSRIVPGIASAIGPMGNVRYGLAAHGDFANGELNGAIHRDGAMRIYHRLSRDAAAVARSAGSPIPGGTCRSGYTGLCASGGGDWPESQVVAMYTLLNGYGSARFGGTATRPVNPVTDCMQAPDEPESYGWGCFQVGRVPIFVLFSDATWHNGPPGQPTGLGAPHQYSPPETTATYANLRDELRRRGGFFVGVSVGRGETRPASWQLARDSMTVDAMGNPIVFPRAPENSSASGSVDLPMVADAVVDAITTIVAQSRQDITTRTDPDTMEMRLPMGRTTAHFIRSVTPVGAIPEAPEGYSRRDMTTFYNVSPSARVEFEVDFYNDFQPGGMTAQLFRATIVVLGRAMSEVDRRDVFIIVPANTSQPPIG